MSPPPPCTFGFAHQCLCLPRAREDVLVHRTVGRDVAAAHRAADPHLLSEEQRANVELRQQPLIARRAPRYFPHRLKKKRECFSERDNGAARQISHMQEQEHKHVCKEGGTAGSSEDG